MKTICIQLTKTRFNHRLYSHSNIKYFSTGYSNGNIKNEILERSLFYVNSLGWKEDSIQSAIIDLKLPPTTYSIINRGVYDLVEYFIEKKHIHMKRKLESHNESDANNNKSDKLHIILEAHIDFIEPYKSSYPTVLSILVDPLEFSYTVNSLMRTADEICMAEDIKVSRLDWYSERLLAILFYASIELYAVSDTSDNLADTRYYYYSIRIVDIFMLHL